MTDQELHALIDHEIEALHHVAHSAGRIPVLCVLLNPDGPDGMGELWTANGVDNDIVAKMLNGLAGAANRGAISNSWHK